MLRQTFVPIKNQLILNLPDNYLNRKVEVIAFAVDEMETEESTGAVGSEPDFSLFRRYRGRYAGGFDREECYDRCLYTTHNPFNP